MGKNQGGTQKPRHFCYVQYTKCVFCRKDFAEPITLLLPEGAQPSYEQGGCICERCLKIKMEETFNKKEIKGFEKNEIYAGVFVGFDPYGNFVEGGDEVPILHIPGMQ